MSMGIFTVKTLRPTEAELIAALGGASGRWTKLVEHVRKTFDVSEEIKFLYGKKYGWGLQFRNKGNALLSLFPNDKYFVALVILGAKGLDEVANLHLHTNARDAITAANLYAEGKWLFISVRDNDDLHDVENILKAKTT
jgi:hypothetical protein